MTTLNSDQIIAQMHEEEAREKFQKVMAGKVKDFTRSVSKRAVYANDRTEGKFQGFYAALQAIEQGIIDIDSVAAARRDEDAALQAVARGEVTV